VTKGRPGRLVSGKLSLAVRVPEGARDGARILGREPIRLAFEVWHRRALGCFSTADEVRRADISDEVSNYHIQRRFSFGSDASSSLEGDDDTATSSERKAEYSFRLAVSYPAPLSCDQPI
jgi:hypothetical protein